MKQHMGGFHNMTIRLLVTGGTFDKNYNEITGDLYFKSTHVPKILEDGRCTLDVNVSELMMIDSRNMDDDYRSTIYRECTLADEDKIVITHGTDSMVETACYLAERGLEKSVVLTGAIIPFAFGFSDSPFNLGSALAFVQVVPPGVYVVMNGRIFESTNVRKDMETCIFHQIMPEHVAPFDIPTDDGRGVVP
jgi:L-asparaginase